MSNHWMSSDYNWLHNTYRFTVIVSSMQYYQIFTYSNQRVDRRNHSSTPSTIVVIKCAQPHLNQPWLPEYDTSTSYWRRRKTGRRKTAVLCTCGFVLNCPNCENRLQWCQMFNDNLSKKLDCLDKLKDRWNVTLIN